MLQSSEVFIIMNMSDTVLKYAQVCDVDAISQCALAAYNKYVDRIGRAPAPMVADFASAVEKNQVIVACYKEVVTGYVVFYPAGDAMHLENVAVLPDYAGMGIGGRLIEYVEKAAKSQCLDAVELYTNEAMTENLSMYPALGYAEYDRRSEDGFNRVYYRKFV